MADGFRPESLIFLFKKIGLDLTAELERQLKCRDMTGVQVYLLVYILRHHANGTYLTELCREIGVSKPTLSALIKKLREKGYLNLREDPDDIRKKKVLPTEKLLAEGDGFVRRAERMEAEICGVLNRQEQLQLWELEQKLLRKLSAAEHGKRNRQEVFYSEKSFTTAGKV